MKILLCPFALIYSTVISFRNKFFDWGIFREQQFDVPIIVVGNLAVGGTGKTPHTEWLISLLKDKYQVAVLSRGYKRQTKGFVLADENSTAQTIGDEPFQIKSKFPDITVAVDKNRCNGIQNLLGSKNLTDLRGKVILLDDAFQHRYVKAGLSILLTDYNCLYTRDCVLPAGRLREPKRGAKRADIVIVTKCTENIDYWKIKNELDLNDNQKLYFSTFRYKEIKPVFYNRQSIADSRQFNILLITGIVNPQPLHDYLAQKTKNIISMNFPDHHNFSQSDIENISKKFVEMTGEKIIITTEKDAARLINNPHLSEDLKPFIYSIGIEVVINKEEEFNANILEYVAKNKRNCQFSEK